jgi:hypothetical protein
VSEATVDVADLRAPDDRASEAPLREDIRLLGRVLGEVIAEQAGTDVLELVESTPPQKGSLAASSPSGAHRHPGSGWLTPPAPGSPHTLSQEPPRSAHLIPGERWQSGAGGLDRLGEPADALVDVAGLHR